MAIVVWVLMLLFQNFQNKNAIHELIVKIQEEKCKYHEYVLQNMDKDLREGFQENDALFDSLARPVRLINSNWENRYLYKEDKTKLMNSLKDSNDDELALALELLSLDKLVMTSNYLLDSGYCGLSSKEAGYSVEPSLSSDSVWVECYLVNMHTGSFDYDERGYTKDTYRFLGQRNGIGQFIIYRSNFTIGDTIEAVLPNQFLQ